MNSSKLGYAEFAVHDAYKATHFVCSASFESRSASIPTLMSSAGLEHSYIFFNRENSRIIESKQKLEHILISSVETVEVFGSDPILSADNIARVARELSKVAGRSIVIDISTMMRETMLILLGLLRQYHPEFDQIWIAYNPAGYPQADESAHETLSSSSDLPVLSYGVSDVRSIIGFSGDIDLTGERHLLVLMGFEVSRAEGLIYAKDPAFVSIGIGDSAHSTSSKNAKLNRYFADELRSKFTGPLNEFTIYPDDAELTAGALASEIKKVSIGKPVVAAMNTKVSACGAAIASWRNPSIELVYAQPALYNHKDYSTPVNDLYLFRLPSN